MPPSQYPYRRAAQEQADAEALVAQQQRTAERLANAQAKQAAREQKAAADTARKTALSQQEMEMRAKGMIPVTTADGNLHEDPLFEQKQAEKAAKEKRDAEAAQLSDQFTREGRKFFTSKVTGMPVALESDAQLEQQRKDRAEQARKNALDERLRAVETATTDPEKRRLPTEARNNLTKKLKTAKQDALATLQSSLQEKAKGTDKAGWYDVVNNNPTPEALAAQERLTRLSQPDADLTDEDLADLEANDATKPLAEKIRNASALLAKDDQAAQFHEQQAATAFDLKLRRDDPAAWAERQRQRRAGMTPEQLAADLESSSADLTARSQEIEAAFQPIQSRRAASQQKLDQLAQQAAQRRQQGLTAGEMVTMTKPDGTTETWPADLAAQFEREQALHQQAEAQDAPLLEKLAAQNDDLQAEAALLSEGSARLNQKRAENLDNAITQMDASAPGTGAFYRAIMSERDTRAQWVKDRYQGREDTPEAKAAINAIHQDFEARSRFITELAQTTAAQKQDKLAQLWDEFGVTRDAKGQPSGARMWDWSKGKSTDPDYDKLGGTSSMPENFKSKIQELGLNEKEARDYMESRRQLDWSSPLDPQKAAQAAEWTRPLRERLGLSAPLEPVRRLPDGAIIPNPILGADKVSFEKAITEAGGTQEQQKKALELWPEYRRQYGESLLTTFGQQSAFGEDFVQWRQENTMPSSDPVDQALAYEEAMKKRGALRRWGDVILSNLTAGFMDVTQAAIGSAAAVTSSQWLSELSAANAENANSLVTAQDQLSNTGLGGSILGAITRMAPGVAATMGTGGAIARLGGSAMAGGMAFGGMQTAGMLYGDVYGKLREQGLDHSQAWKTAAPASALAGTMTAILTRLFPGGAESVINDSAARQGMRTLIAAAASSGKAVTKGALDEIPEELIDEGFSQLVQGYAEGRTPDEVVTEFITGLPELVASAGLMGAGLQAVKEFSDSRNPSKPEVNAPAWAAIENHVATDATGQVDQILTEQQQRRAALALSIAQGGELFDVEATDLAAAGWTRDGDKFKPLKDYTGPQVLDIDSGGLPVIKDSYIAALRQTGLAPVADAIGMTETQTRNFYAQRNTPTTPDQNTPAGSQQPQQTGGAPAPAGSRPDANPSPVQAPAGNGNEPARSGSAPAPSGNAVSDTSAPATVADTLANHLAERGLPPDQAAAAATEITSRPEFAGKTYEEIITSNIPFASTLADLGITGSLNSKDVATNPLKAGSKFDRIRDKMAKKAEAAKAAAEAGRDPFEAANKTHVVNGGIEWSEADLPSGSPKPQPSRVEKARDILHANEAQLDKQLHAVWPSAKFDQDAYIRRNRWLNAMQLLADNGYSYNESAGILAGFGFSDPLASNVAKSPAPDFATLRQQLKNREISDRDASRQVAEAVGATTHEAFIAAMQQHLGWKPLRAEIASHSHFGTKDESSIPMASSGRASNRSATPSSKPFQRGKNEETTPGRQGPDPSLAEGRSPLRDNRVWSTDKLRVLSSIKRPKAPPSNASPKEVAKYEKALRAFENKLGWTREVFRILENRAARHHAFIQAIAVGKAAIPHLDGNSVAIIEIDGLITLAIDTDALIANISDLESPQDLIDATLSEERIHVSQIILGQQDPENYGRAALVKKWDELPEALQKAVWTSYHNANQRAKSFRDARLPRVMTEARKYHLMQEFNRMLVQDKHFAGQITETVDPASGLMEWIKNLLKNLGQVLRNMISKLPESQQAEIEEHVRRVKEVYDNLETLSRKVSADRLAVLPSLRDPAAYAATVLQQLGTAENAGILSDAALARVFDQLDPSLQSRAFALWKTKNQEPGTKNAPKDALMRGLLSQFLGSRRQARQLLDLLSGITDNASGSKSSNLLAKITARFRDKTTEELLAAQSAQARQSLSNLLAATLHAIGGFEAASWVHGIAANPTAKAILQEEEPETATTPTRSRRWLLAQAQRPLRPGTPPRLTPGLTPPPPAPAARQQAQALQDRQQRQDAFQTLIEQEEAANLEGRTLTTLRAEIDGYEMTDDERSHRDASSPAAGPALRRKLRQEEMARAHQIAYARGEALAEIQLLTDQRRLPEPTKRLLFDLMKVAAGRFEPENQKTTSWKLAGYATEQTLQRLGLRISPQGYLLTIDPVNTVAYVERRHVIIRQDTLDTVADLVPAVAAYLHLRLGSEYDQRQKHGLPTFAKPEPQTTDEEPESDAGTPARTLENQEQSTTNEEPAPTFTPLAEGQSPFAANTPAPEPSSFVIRPSSLPQARIPLGGRNSLPAQFATAEDLAAFQYQLDRDALLREGTPEKDRNAARDRITALRARLIDETGASKEEVEQKLADYHRAVIDAAKKADPVEVFRPVSFSNFLRARGTQAKADTLVAPEGGDLISALQGRVKRIGKISQSRTAGEWDWYRQLQQQVQAENAGRPLSRRQLQQAQKAAQNGDVSTPLNLLQWINLNVVDADKGMPIDEAATALSDTGKLDENDPNAQQPFDVDGTSLGEAILAAIDARVALRDQGGDPALRQEAEALRQGSDFRAVAEGAPGRAFTGSELAARLQPGDEIQLGTEWLTVTDVDTEEGTVALDSDRYGPQGLEPNQTIHLLAIGGEQLTPPPSPVSDSPLSALRSPPSGYSEATLAAAKAELTAALAELGLAASPRLRAAAASFADQVFHVKGIRTFPDFLAYVAEEFPRSFDALKTPHLRSAWNTVLNEKDLPEVTRPEEAAALRPYAPRITNRPEPDPATLRRANAVTEESLGIPSPVTEVTPVNTVTPSGNTDLGLDVEVLPEDPNKKIQNYGSTRQQREQAIDETFGPFAPGVAVMDTKNQDGVTLPHIMRGRGLMLSIDGRPHVAMRQVALPSLGTGESPGVRFLPLAGDKSNWTGFINAAIQKAAPDLDQRTDYYLEPYGGGLVYLQNLDVLLRTDKPVIIASSQEFEPDRNAIYNALREGDPATIADLQTTLTDMTHVPQTDVGRRLADLLFGGLQNRSYSAASAEAAKQLPRLAELLRRPNVQLKGWNDVQTFDLATKLAQSGKRVTLLEDSNYADLPGEETEDQYASLDAGPMLPGMSQGQITEFIGKNPRKLLAQKLPVYRAVLDAGGTVIATNNMNPTLLNGLLAEFGDAGHWFGYAHPTRVVPDGWMRHPDGKGVLWSNQRPEYLAILQKGVVNPPQGAPHYGTDTPAGLDYRTGPRRPIEDLDRAAQPRRTPSPYTGGSREAAESLRASAPAPEPRRPAGQSPRSNTEPRTPALDATLAGGPGWDRVTSARVAAELDADRRPGDDPLETSPEIQQIDLEAELAEAGDTQSDPSETSDPSDEAMTYAEAKQALLNLRAGDQLRDTTNGATVTVSKVESIGTNRKTGQPTHGIWFTDSPNPNRLTEWASMLSNGEITIERAGQALFASNRSTNLSPADALRAIFPHANDPSKWTHSHLPQHRPNEGISWERENAANLFGGGTASRPNRAFTEERIARDGQSQRAELGRLLAQSEVDEASALQLGDLLDHGGEHTVYVSPDARHVIKITKPGLYGYVPTEDVAPGVTGDLRRIKLRRATPAEYLLRTALFSRLTGTDWQMHGLEFTDEATDSPVIVSSQPFIPQAVDAQGNPVRVTQPQIDAYMSAIGFQPVEETTGTVFRDERMEGQTYWHPKEQVLAADARPANFRITPDGVVVPVDLMLAHYPLAASQRSPSDAGTPTRTSGPLPSALRSPLATDVAKAAAQTNPTPSDAHDKPPVTEVNPVPLGATPRTPAFDRWFAGSKIVNPDGTPRVVFHGSNAVFSRFENIDNRKVPQWYFSSDPANASAYALGSDPSHFAPGGILADDLPENTSVYPVYLSIQNPLLVDAQGEPWDQIQHAGRLWDTESLAAYAKQQGHDGVIIENVQDSAGDTPESTTFVAFHPEQIKSQFNSGTWDTRNPDILAASNRLGTAITRSASAVASGTERTLQVANTLTTALGIQQPLATFGSNNLDKRLAAQRVAAAASQTDPNPTPAQKRAGNYAKGKVDLHGLRISIENPAGSVRSGTDAAGKPWSITLPHHYGYILGSEGRDGDHVDVFIGPNPDSQLALIINQRKPGNGHFDEHKVMLGFNTPAEAARGYMASYTKGWKGLGSAVPTTIPVFKHWLTTKDTTQPVTKEQLEKLAKTVPLPSSAHDKPALASSDRKEQTSPMASASGAAQSNKPSPGGLSEAEARNPMTIYRAGDADEVGVKPWASFTPERSVAEAYTDNPGFGGDTVRELRIDAGNVLDLTSGNKFKKLAEALGLEGQEAIDKADEWHSNGWNYPWEESSKVKRALEDSDFDAVQYTDDFPAGATTIIFTRTPSQIDTSFESSRAAGGTLAASNRLGQTTSAAFPIKPDMDQYQTWKGTKEERDAEWERWHRDIASWEQAAAEFAAKQGNLGLFVSGIKTGHSKRPYRQARAVTRIPGKGDQWRVTLFSQQITTPEYAPKGDWANDAWVPISHNEFPTKQEAYLEALREIDKQHEFTTQPLFAGLRIPIGTAITRSAAAVASGTERTLQVANTLTKALGIQQPLATFGSNNLDKRLAAQLDKLAGPKIRSAKTAVETWLDKPDGLAPSIKGLVDQILPTALLPREWLALHHEMQRKTAYGQETANDLIRALSGNPRLSDLAYPKEFAENPAARAQLFDAMEGRIPMATLPPAMQRLGQRLRDLLRQTGSELVRQGLMNPDTFEELQSNGWMPRYTEDEARESAGSFLAAFKLGVRDLLQQRSTAYHIVDTTRKDKTGQFVTVSRDEGGKRNRWRFRDAASRDAFYHQLIRQHALAALQEDNKHPHTKTLLDALDAKTRREVRADIKKLTSAEMELTAKVSPAVARLIKSALHYQAARFLPKDPFEPAKLVKDPVYAVARYVLGQTHNAATMELLKKTAAHPEWVSDVSLTGFTAIPDASRFGPLAGKHVRKDIAAQILDLVDVPNAGLQFYDAILSKWKAGKLVWNPGSHVRDAVGNTMFAYLAGSSIWNPGNWPYYQQAIAALRTGGKDFAELIEQQVIGGDAYTGLVKERLKGLLPDPKTVEGYNPGFVQRLLFGFGASLHGSHEFLASLRRLPDDLFKSAAYFKHKAEFSQSQGLPVSESARRAADEVRKWFPYYDRLGQSGTTRAVGRFVNPFVSFFRESTRILGTAVAERPLALTAALSFPALITALGAMALGLDDDDMEEIQKDMAGKGKLFATDTPLFSMLLPFRSAQGAVQQFDISAIMPFADLLGTRVVVTEADEDPWNRFWRGIVSGGPVLSLVDAWRHNEDAFTRRPIAEFGMTPLEKITAYAKHAAGVALPPLAPGGTAFNTLMRAGDRATNKTLETYDPAQAVIRSVAGLNVKNATPDLYRLADDWRKAHGYEVTEGMDYGSTTPASRARKALFAQLAQDNPNPAAIKNILNALDKMGRPVRTEQDVNKLLFYRDPLKLIGGNKAKGITAPDAQAQFRASLKGEARAALENALQEYQRIKATAPSIIARARTP